MEHTVGEFARRTGLTNRTLHHYEELGLLRPTRRSTSGYRLYGSEDLARLHKILAYRYFGLSLKAIAELLDADKPSLHEVLQRQMVLVQEQIQRQQRLLDALTECTRAAVNGATDLSEGLFGLVTAMRLCEAALTEAELQRITGRRTTLGDEGLLALQAESVQLIEAMNAAMQRGADPACDEVQALTVQSIALRNRLTDGDESLHEKVREVAAQVPELLRARGISPELAAFIRAARLIHQHAGEPRKPKASTTGKPNKTGKTSKTSKGAQ